MPPLHLRLRHSEPVAQGSPSLFTHTLGPEMNLLPGAQTHALSACDHVAPLPAGQAQELAPAETDVDPPPQAAHGASPAGPNEPAAHWQDPEAVATDVGDGHAETHTAASTPVSSTLLAQSPEAHCGPDEQGVPSTERHCPAASAVPGAQAQALATGSHVSGAGHEQDVAPEPEVAPAGQATQGAWPLALEYVFAVHMQLPLASRAEDAGHAATHTVDEHVPLAQSAPLAQVWLFWSRHWPLEATKAWVVGWLHTQALVASDHVAPLPPGQVQELAPVDVDVDPPPQATHGVRPSTLAA